MLILKDDSYCFFYGIFENMISIMTSFFSGKPNEIMIFSVTTRFKLVNWATKKRWLFIYVSKIEIFAKN